MTPTEDLLRSMLRKASATTVCETLRAQGYTVSRRLCDKMRGEMLRSGEAPRVDQRGRRIAERFSEDPTMGAREGSERLHDRIQRLYERTARKHGTTPETAYKMLNFSRAQLEKMAA